MSEQAQPTVREYVDADEPEVLELLTRSLGAGPGGERSLDFFRWKHVQNPFGRSFMLVAELDGQVVGFRSLMRWQFRSVHGEVRAVRAVDTATDPEHQGRGIFSLLTRAAIAGLEGGADTIFNTPNEKSLPGYLKMGWEEVGIVPVHARIRRPLRFVRSRIRRRHAPVAEPPTVDAAPARELLEGTAALEVRRPLDDHLRTNPVPGFLEWRYAAAPLLDYRAVGDPDVGVAVFRVRPRGSAWETTVAELEPRGNEVAAAAELLRRVVAAAPVDQVTAHLTPDSVYAAAARRRGFLPMPGGIRLVARPFHDDVTPDPRVLSNWRFSLGDLEVF